MDSRAFYDKYVGRQLAIGVNERHYAILRWLERFGLRPGDRVLEIGCGVGTLSGLIAGVIGPEGSLLAVDLSSKSIEAARERLSMLGNTRFEAGDILELLIRDRFDVVVLPDVIEHIPLKLHPELFARVSGWVKPDGFVLLHYPNPHYSEWCREHRPELLQIVDQAIHVDALTANSYPHGLYLEFLQTYPIWTRESEYQVAVMRPNPERVHFTEAELRPRVLERIRRVVSKLVQ
jgi:cyclopropane fatty-acyl-phospholipid synthase-like methyltransferase